MTAAPAKGLNQLLLQRISRDEISTDLGGDARHDLGKMLGRVSAPVQRVARQQFSAFDAVLRRRCCFGGSVVQVGSICPLINR